MALNSNQISQLTSMLAQELGGDKEKINAVVEHFFRTTSMDAYANIRSYAHRLYDHLQGGIVAPTKEEELLGVFMERSCVARLLAATPSDGYIFATLGIHNNSMGNEELTISLLGARADFSIVRLYSGSSDISGEEIWQNRATFAEMDLRLP
jgi:hypothetical protein